MLECVCADGGAGVASLFGVCMHTRIDTYACTPIRLDTHTGNTSQAVMRMLERAYRRKFHEELDTRGR